MASFPTLSCGYTTRYPAAHAVEIPSGVIRFEDDTEQRWQRSSPLHRWTLTFNEISAADLSTIRTFWLACKGVYDKTWDITVDSVTYSYCTFEDDDFAATETKEGRFTLSLKIRQVRPN